MRLPYWRRVAPPVQRRSEDRLITVEQPAELGHLVESASAVELRHAARDLLQADHVGVAEGADGPGDAREVDASVDAAAALDVPGQDFHHLIPARMKDWTNWR